MNFPTQTTPTDAYTYYPNRPRTTIFGHHTAGPSLPTPSRGASWNHIIDRDPVATIYSAVPLDSAPHTISNTNRHRPPSVLRCPDGRVSDANYCGVHVEIVYAPQAPYNQRPTSSQLASLNTLLRYYYALYGPLPFWGHGEVDTTKWPTEPHGLDYAAAGLGPHTSYGRFLVNPPTEDTCTMDPISDEDLKIYFEQLGTPVNMETAIIKRASRAYRVGETRGPAVSDEYLYAPSNRIRQRFSAATAEYDPETGGVGWAELNLHPEE